MFHHGGELLPRLEPESVERTVTVSPTAADLLPRISSIMGPGQKLPRASITWFATATHSPQN